MNQKYYRFELDLIDNKNAFGIIIGCCKRDYCFAKGTVASARHYMPDVPICLLVDGDFDVSPLQKAYGIDVLYQRNVKDKWLRDNCTGWGLPKMIAFWESPYEQFVWLDADTVVWGDIRLAIKPSKSWDFITTNQTDYFTPERINKYFFKIAKIQQLYPDFDWRAYSQRYFCTGVFCARRNIFELSFLKEMLFLSNSEVGLFFPGEMGFLNFMVFYSEQFNGLRVTDARIQAVIGDLSLSYLNDRWKVGQLVPTVNPAEPVVLHYTIPKPETHWGQLTSPMTIFRSNALVHLYAFNPVVRKTFFINWLLKIEDLKWRWPRIRAKIGRFVRNGQGKRA